MEGVGPEIRPNPYAVDESNNNGVRPLLIDLVLQKVFSFSDVQELLASRRVCTGWGFLATQELRSRDGVEARIGRNEGSDKDEIAGMTDFIRVMTPALQSEAGMPLMRIDLSLDLLRVAPLTMDFLRFIAPWVQSIRLHWLRSEPDFSSNQVEEVVRALEAGLEGVFFPALRELAVGNDVVLYPTEGLHFAAMILVKGLITAAKGLTCYDHAFRFAVDNSTQEMLMRHIVRALPPSLKRLGFLHGSSVSFEVLNTCHFQLEEYLHTKDREYRFSYPNDVLAFLTRQAGALRNLQLSFLEHLYHTTYPTFPMFPLVTRLRTKVTRLLRFEWVGKVPALRHLELDYRYSYGSIDPPEIRNPQDIRRLPQHRGVRSLGVRSIGVGPGRGPAMVPFEILRHVFPNLTILNFTANWHLERELAHLCTHMIGLEVLKLTWELRRAGSIPFVHADLEAILCGLPLRVEEGEPAVVDLPVFGLTNLKKLKRLDLSGASVHFELMLTPLILFHAFRRMGELKEIRLNELHPQALEGTADMIQVLREDGIEVSVKEVL